MNNEYNVYDENEKEVPVFTTPEDVLLAWEKFQVIRKKEDIPDLPWEEFLNWLGNE
jgi:hypothetical protein